LFLAKIAKKNSNKQKNGCKLRTKKIQKYQSSVFTEKNNTNKIATLVRLPDPAS